MLNTQRTDWSTVSAYSAFHIVGDVVGLLDALGLDKVFVVGHDWGATIAWYLCLFRPDRVIALVNTSVAFMRHVMIRAGPDAVKTTEYFRRAYGPTYYIVRFQEPGVAEQGLSPANARYTMKKILCNRYTDEEAGHERPSTADGDNDLLPSWVTEADVDYYASVFEKTGFTGGLNYYRNMDRNWEHAAPWSDAKVTVPTKFIVGDGDITYHWPGIQDYIHKGGFKADVPLLEDVVVIPGAGHLTQQEKADEVSKHIHDFIANLPSNSVSFHRQIAIQNTAKGRYYPHLSLSSQKKRKNPHRDAI
ncbi:hypothetical protein EJB05_03364, partial [Eragrostis curvula]